MQSLVGGKGKVYRAREPRLNRDVLWTASNRRPLSGRGYGEVWKARDTRLDRTVAIKFAKAGFGERFEREARAVAALSHPNICQIFDVAPDHFVMEYVDGAPVRPLESTRALLDVAVQIADGLAAAHAAGVVHRDLKPDNILVTKSGRVKILDFGLARLQAAEADATAALTITQPGTVMGTLAYMSPEQARGQDLDARSDQFSFGVILYELAAGRSPFRKESSAETMAALIRDEAPPLPAAVPPALRWVIERLLSKDPGRTMLERLDVSTGRSTEVAELPPGFRPSSTMAGARLSLSADGKMLATSVVAGESDIWIMDGFELPRRFWEIWPR